VVEHEALSLVLKDGLFYLVGVVLLMVVLLFVLWETYPKLFLTLPLLADLLVHW
jgi:hypothetical protein